jgi:hypothetical protein
LRRYLFAVYAVAEPTVEPQVLSVETIGVEPDLRETERSGYRLSVRMWAERKDRALGALVSQVAAVMSRAPAARSAGV